MSDQPEQSATEATEEQGHPEPPSEAELARATAGGESRDPLLRAYAAVFAYIQQLPAEITYLDPVTRNAIIWRAVHAALDATPVGRCVSSHCVEGDHILTVDDEPACDHDSQVMDHKGAQYWVCMKCGTNLGIVDESADWRPEDHEGHGSPCEYRPDGSCAHPARTTPDNPATSTNPPDNPLRERAAEALWPLTDWDGDRLNAAAAADAVLAALQPELDQPAQVRFARRFVAKIPGQPDIHGIEFPDSGQVLADVPGAGLTRFLAIDVITDEYPDAAIHWADEQQSAARHDDGPSVQEAAADDRRWPLQKAGE